MNPLLKLGAQVPAENIGKRKEPALGGIDGVQVLNLLVEILFFRSAGHVAIRPDQDHQEREQETQIVGRWRKHKRVDAERSDLGSHAKTSAAEELSQVLVAAAEVEYE